MAHSVVTSIPTVGLVLSTLPVFDSTCVVSCETSFELDRDNRFQSDFSLFLMFLNIILFESGQLCGMNTSVHGPNLKSLPIAPKLCRSTLGARLFLNDIV